MENLTPMLRQLHEVKAEYPDCILFFRLGDFYEMFGEDAQKASGILDVVLTSRNAGKSGRIPMCGIPFHAAENYITKLIKAGLKVAICEQVEDPALAKGLVKRSVIRVITSGTYIDESSFESRYLASLCVRDTRWGIAFTDTSSGVIQTNEYLSHAEVTALLSRLPVYECVFPLEEEDRIKKLFKNSLLRSNTIALSAFQGWSFNTDIARKSLQEHFQIHNLKGFGIDQLPASISASGGLLEYLKQMHKQPLRHLHKISLYADQDYVFISPPACYGLGLEGLLETIDQTLTNLGKRKLRDWLYRPLKSKEKILQRQHAVTLLKGNNPVRQELQKLMRNIPDIEKSISRISCANTSAKDLLALRTTLLKQPEIRSAIAPLTKESKLLALEDIPNLRTLLETAINQDIPLAHAEGRIIRRGYHTELDELRTIQDDGKGWLKKLQEQESKRTGISSLKVGFNQVFGYYIEVSKANLNHVPQDYIRKQTLANAERYITPQLKEFEEKILTAEEKILAIERALIEKISQEILDYSEPLHGFCEELSTLDALYSLSILSETPGYHAPTVSDDIRIDIQGGRHPVVEKAITEPFIPNDTLLDAQGAHLVILTGPNMAGKSTYIRQTALLVIMAQMGSYLPAVSASIGIVDKIFTRIGAHDEITKGQSTFMVEMSEAAGILHNLTERSLVILDEIGRGTSTFDGLSLAWAISEHLARTKARTLFATHFHELTALAEEFPGVKNYNVAVKEWNNEIIFLHKIVEGGTDDSYGIYVAKLAGIPKEVLTRAQAILNRLELHSDLREKIRNRLPAENQLSLFSSGNSGALQELQDQLLKIDLNNLTPLEALHTLQELKQK
ncbi:MAG: DNA mismatch repair protein MutS, partial [Candidatus Omnitrophica bacterium]|nr:DNA mismatch repair protein MutS [Candidatus Omnitrophota bacterium]